MCVCFGVFLLPNSLVTNFGVMFQCSESGTRVRFACNAKASRNDIHTFCKWHVMLFVQSFSSINKSMFY